MAEFRSYQDEKKFPKKLSNLPENAGDGRWNFGLKFTRQN